MNTPESNNCPSHGDYPAKWSACRVPGCCAREQMPDCPAAGTPHDHVPKQWVAHLCPDDKLHADPCEPHFVFHGTTEFRRVVLVSKEAYDAVTRERDDALKGFDHESAEHAKCERGLKDQVARMRAVVEAARAMGAAWNHAKVQYDMDYTLVDKVAQAVDALASEASHEEKA